MIVIKDFEMPSSCWECPLYKSDYNENGELYENYCLVNGANWRLFGMPYSLGDDPYRFTEGEEEEIEKRPDDCPLIYVESEAM